MSAIKRSKGPFEEWVEFGILRDVGIKRGALGR